MEKLEQAKNTVTRGLLDSQITRLLLGFGLARKMTERCVAYREAQFRRKFSNASMKTYTNGMLNVLRSFHHPQLAMIGILTAKIVFLIDLNSYILQR